MRSWTFCSMSTDAAKPVIRGMRLSCRSVAGFILGISDAGFVINLLFGVTGTAGLALFLGTEAVIARAMMAGHP
jgi:hypothetical protein